jgi:hypothetical protein
MIHHDPPNHQGPAHNLLPSFFIISTSLIQVDQMDQVDQVDQSVCDG